MGRHWWERRDAPSVREPRMDAGSIPSGTDKGVEMDEAATERLVSGRSWRDFCEVLQRVGGMLEEMDRDVTEVDRAEWYRCITRVLRVACERYLENSEPYHPRLRMTPWRTSVNVQSPDQDHLLCEFVDASRSYRIS